MRTTSNADVHARVSTKVHLPAWPHSCENWMCLSTWHLHSAQVYSSTRSRGPYARLAHDEIEQQLVPRPQPQAETAVHAQA
jgi:hypothetical protein